MGKGNKEWIWGRNPVYEVLRANRRSIHELRFAHGSNQQGQFDEIFQLAKKRNLPILQVDRRSLDDLTEQHQGIALLAGPYPYADLMEMLDLAESRREPLFVLVLDVLKDPQNLATLIRTGEAVGIHGIVLPYRQTATVTPAVVNASSGATEHMRVFQANIAQTLSRLKEAGAWVVGLDSSRDAQLPEKIDLTGPMVVVVGSEGEGMRRLVQESCDFLMRLPMQGNIDSLNAAVAGSVALYLVWQARGYQGGK